MSNLKPAIDEDRTGAFKSLRPSLETASMVTRDSCPGQNLPADSLQRLESSGSSGRATTISRMELKEQTGATCVPRHAPLLARTPRSRRLPRSPTEVSLTAAGGCGRSWCSPASLPPPV